MAPGGGAANTPSALARMGLEVTAFSKVGNDPNGSFILNELRQVGVDTAGVGVSTKDSTPFTFVGIHDDGDRTFIHTPGSNVTFSLEDIDWTRVSIASFSSIRICGCCQAWTESPRPSLLEEARKRGVMTFLDEALVWAETRIAGGHAAALRLRHSKFDDLQVLYPNSTAESLRNG